MIHQLAKISNFFVERVRWSATPRLAFRGAAGNSFRYEKLEARQVLAGIAFDPISGVVTITGTEANDISIVSMLSDNQIRVTLAGHPRKDLPLADVNRVVFYGLEGDDYFRNDTWIPAEAFGGLGNDTLIGGWGNDILYGEEGDDNLQGRAGNDFLYGGDGDDRLVGGAGDDILLGGFGNDRLFGTSGNNLIFGGDGDDLIFGGSGNDELRGEGGDDFISTGEGTNFADGGDGNDTIFGGSGDNFLLGGFGDDYIRGGSGNDRIEGISGHNRLFGGAGDDTIIGGDGNDLIRGGAGHDFIDGQSGNNVIYGDDGNDYIIGGSGDDIIFGGNGNDEIRGGDGNDIIYGGDGDDLIFGGNGDDLIYGGNGNDEIRGGDGDDIIYGGAGDDLIFGGAGNDLLYGEDGNDILQGQDGNDQLFGGNGDDRLYGGAGNDILRGGDGNDGLFGGTTGNNQLFGGSGKNRFLISTLAQSEIMDLKDSDAILEFRNGGRNWSNVEIRVVDETLQAMHQRTGNTRLLKGTLTNQPLVFIKEIGVASGRYGDNQLVTINTPVFNPVTGRVETQTRVEHQIRLPDWDEFDETANQMVMAEVAREIGYNWSTVPAMTAALPTLAGILPSFNNISGWTSTSPSQNMMEFYWKSLDNRWWYLKASAFSENYARTNPEADFTAMMKFYFDPMRRPGQQQAVLQKFNLLNEFFSRLEVF
jgi:Ca2+-binding RTX toxin-like protein